MIYKAKDVEKGQYIRLGECRQWRRVKSVKPGLELTKFKLEGNRPIAILQSQSGVFVEDRPGYIKGTK